MKDFELKHKRHEKYLSVKGTGTSSTLRSIFESTQKLLKIVEDNNSKFILLDYSELETITSNTDIFTITRIYENKAPLLYPLFKRIIINTKEIHLEKYWEEICRLRGFNYNIILNAKDAEVWLLQQVTEVR